MSLSLSAGAGIARPRLEAYPRWVRAASAVAVATVAALAITVVTNEYALLRFDRAIEAAAIDARTGWLDTAMVWLTFLGTRYAVGAIAFGLVLWSAITGRARGAVAVIVGAALLNPVVEVLLKEMVGRVRPDTAQLLPGNGPSFPSGHVVAAAGFYGTLPLLVWQATRRTWARAAAVAAAVAVIVTVAVTRVYLDVHWATDAFAGLLVGAVLVDLTFRTYFSRPAPRRVLAPAAAR
jgi:undecaprenyl-diphosphatase